MGTEDAMNRRDILRWAGRAAVAAAAAPVLFTLTGAHAERSRPLIQGDPEDVGMSPDRLEDVFARVARRVGDGLFPGATALVARRGVIVGHRAFGAKVRGNDDEPVTLDTIFDLQSMTKVVATAISAMILVDRGVLTLETPVAAFLPEFAANGKADVTVHDVLRYSSGLPIDNQFLDNADDAAVWRLMAETALEYPTGTSVLYSDLGYRLLGRMLEAAAGMSLDALARQAVWGPLGMHDTMFTPPASLVPRIAATGYSDVRGYLVRGEVQDEQDFALGGITGCDGVFGTALDLAIFCQMILNRGRYGEARILSRHLAREMVKDQTPHADEAAACLSPIMDLLVGPKGYGWEMWAPRFSTGGMRISRRSYGSIGGAGTFMWVDPERELIGVLLTNHGLPVPVTEQTWNLMLDATAPGEFYDGIVAALDGDDDDDDDD